MKLDRRDRGKLGWLAAAGQQRTLELQGHGRTTDIDRPITYPNLADDVAAFMDAVGLETADVFGYSMGAAVGLQLAIRHAEGRAAVGFAPRRHAGDVHTPPSSLSPTCCMPSASRS